MIPIMIIASAVLTYKGLVALFLTVEVWGAADTHMNIPETLKILWEEEIYWCAIVICGFSVVFPFFKLLCLAIIWIMPNHS
jgi:uncharacterized paraquat-inducible protein A